MLAIFVATAMQNLMPSQLVRVPLEAGKAVSEIDGVESTINADEIIPSVNIAELGASSVKIEVRAHVGERLTKWYDTGTYSAAGPRASVKSQKDADGDVLTDTLRLTEPSTRIDLRVTRSSALTGGEVFACFSSKESGYSPVSDPQAAPTALGPLAVPALAQGDFIKGEVLCSPTSTAMVLEYWSKELQRPELYKNANEVSEGVWDPIYDGGGNWAFNVGFVGSFPGMRSYVSRFSSIDDLKEWVAAGFPVICSVASSMLDGAPLSPKEHGHLVVITGFTAEGDVLANDPGHRDRLHRTYLRANFEAAWLHSRRTVYVVQPLTMKPPTGSRGMWIEG